MLGDGNWRVFFFLLLLKALSSDWWETEGFFLSSAESTWWKCRSWELSTPVLSPLLWQTFMCRLFLPAICSVEAQLLLMLRKMCWNVINSENSVRSCKTTATVQDHYKSVPICTLNKCFRRIFSTLMILSNRFVFCWPLEEQKVILMWLLTVSDMPLVTLSRNFHVNIPYFEGITIFWVLLPWILLKILSRFPA